MQYSEGTIGRVFTLRLDSGERVPDVIEQFAKDHDIKRAHCTLLGGIDKGNIVVGPKDGDAPVIDPIIYGISGAHEVAAVGTIFPDEEGTPILHMHAALGHDGETRMGCIRPGLNVWLVGEVVIMEILGNEMLRKIEKKSGLKLLSKA